MTKLFIHHLLFRVLSPIFSGVIVYLLILLINNNIAQLQEYFLGEELYLCIGLSYLTQEFSRLSLILFANIKIKISFVLKLGLQLFASILLSIMIVSLSIYTYYGKVLGFSPNLSELLLFNGIFSSVTLIYISLYLSHQFLNKINNEKIANELLLKKGVEEDFKQFRKGINPELLFESFEVLIVLMHKNKENSEELIERLSAVYRYILSAKSSQLVTFQEEIEVLKELISLFNYLPYQRIKLNILTQTDSLIVPTSLLIIAESIIRSSIISSETAIKINISENQNYILLTYQAQEKISTTLELADLEDINKSYHIYSERMVFLEKDNKKRLIGIPKLNKK